MLEAVGQGALRTLLLAAAVQLVLWLFRVRQAQLLLMAWTVVLAASLAMPALQWATPLRLPILPALSGMIPPNPNNPNPNNPSPNRPTADPADAAPRQPPPATTQTAGPTLSADLDDPIPLHRSLTAIYLLVTTALTLRLVIGVALSLRLLGRAAPLHTDCAAGRVRLSPDVASPVTIARVILLPDDALDWPASMRHAVLAHERAHVARWDFAMLAASQLNRAVFWFSPLSWWLHHRLAALAELASDDRAMAVTGDCTGYAEVLLEMGRRSGPLLRGLAMARPSTLLYRIERILSNPPQPTAASPVQQAILTIGAVGLSIAAASPQPNSSPPPILTAPQVQPQILAQVLAQVLASSGFDPPPPQTPAIGPGPMPALAAGPVTQPQPLILPQAAATTRPPLPSLSQLVRTARPVPRTKVRNEPTRATPALLPLPSTARPIPAIRDQDPPDAALPTHSVLATGATVPARSPATQPTVLRSNDEPACTGVYRPRPGLPSAIAPLDLIQAKYVQGSDGTPMLRILLGIRDRGTLRENRTGIEVERIWVRTTVITTLPRGTNHLAGTTQGPYGAVDFKCEGSSAHL